MTHAGNRAPTSAAKTDQADELLERVRSEQDPLRQARLAGELIALYQQRGIELAQLRRDAINRARVELGMNFTAIGAELGLTRGRITQIRQAGPASEPALFVPAAPVAGQNRSTDGPDVLLIGGYAGSGKSELAHQIARRTGWGVLDKDTLTRPVVEAALEALGRSPHDRESEIYRSIVRPAEYAALLEVVEENAQAGASVVVTAPFIAELRDRAWCDRLFATLGALGAKLNVVWVRCDMESMRRYIRQRGAARDAAKLASWDDYIKGVDLEYLPVTPHFLVNNSYSYLRPLQDQAAELLTTVGVS